MSDDFVECIDRKEPVSNDCYPIVMKSNKSEGTLCLLPINMKHNPFGSDYLKADSALNRIYSDVLNAEDPMWGTTTMAGIKQTQRCWIRYRDAWVVFEKKKCFKLDASVLKTVITKERIAQLRDFADE